MTFLVQALLVFVLTTVVSVLWAWYFRHAAAGHAHRAALSDVGIVTISMVNVVSYTHDPRLGIPVILGTYLGTVWAIRRKGPAQPTEP